MRDFKYTLVTDGSSDRALIPILTWLLEKELGIDYVIQPEWADFSSLPRPPRSLVEKINLALDLYPTGDLLFIHRDAEKEPRENRLKEINCALLEANINELPVVCVIPVRMLEAWLLFDEVAIRKAAGNPNGRCEIPLPALNKVEDLPDPKDKLLESLKKASELKGRQLKKFNSREKIHRLANVINDFSPLHQLSAFQELKRELSDKLCSRGLMKSTRKYK
jgi:hypothetical protein